MMLQFVVICLDIRVAINHFRSNFSVAADNGREINVAPAYVCSPQSFSTSRNTEKQ
jgi:hypothetical protein